MQVIEPASLRVTRKAAAQSWMAPRRFDKEGRTAAGLWMLAIRWTILLGLVAVLVAVMNVMSPLDAAREYGHETLLLSVLGSGLAVL